MEKLHCACLCLGRGLHTRHTYSYIFMNVCDWLKLETKWIFSNMFENMQMSWKSLKHFMKYISSFISVSLSLKQILFHVSSFKFQVSSFKFYFSFISVRGGSVHSLASTSGLAARQCGFITAPVVVVYLLSGCSCCCWQSSRRGNEQALQRRMGWFGADSACTGNEGRRPRAKFLTAAAWKTSPAGSADVTYVNALRMLALRLLLPVYYHTWVLFTTIVKTN